MFKIKGIRKNGEIINHQYDNENIAFFEYDLFLPIAKEIKLYENDNVKAYVHKETGIRLELISKIYGTAEQIISQFDFSITKFAYYKAEIEDETGKRYSGKELNELNLRGKFGNE